ncbi:MULTISPECIES: hypothetical protein [unclassified Variovorax]|nr:MULTISPECIES: hypothetical protein [unclassified Variovorax]
MSMMHLPGGIHMVFDGRPIMVAKNSDHYEAVRKALVEKQKPEDILEILDGEKRRLEAAVLLTPNVEVKGGQVLYKGEPVAGVIVQRMLDMLEEGFDLTPSANFLENLMLNPSLRVVEHLYEFLEVGKLALTEDGCFVAYKAITEDWLDIYTRSIDNSIGQTPTMLRNKVDENPDRTCSRGLHVCSYDYLPHFANANGRIVECKVNPADVVAIPRDYNNTKMRVCRYEVTRDLTDAYKADNNILTAATVAADMPFIVEVDYGSGWREHEAFDRLSDAAAEFEDVVENGDVNSVRLRNRVSDVTIDERNGIDRGDRELDNDAHQDDLEGFTVHGVQHDGVTVQLEDDHGGGTSEEGVFDSVQDAVAFALDDETGYAEIRILDRLGNTVKTLS